MKYNVWFITLVLFVSQVHTSSQHEWAALHNAAKNGLVDRVGVLLAKDRQRVSAKDGEGSTPLHKAAERGCAKVVEQLLTSHATIDAQDSKGRTPLQLALCNAHTEVARMLLNCGANMYVQDYQKGLRALHCAALGSNVDCIQLLVQAGVDVDSVDKRGQPALHQAAARNSEGVVLALLFAGADVSIRDGKGRTALQLAVKNPYVSVGLVRILAKRGAPLTPAIEQLLQEKPQLCEHIIQAQDSYLEAVRTWKQMYLEPTLPSDLIRYALQVALPSNQRDRLSQLEQQDSSQ